MKKTARTILKRIFALTLCVSLCMSVMTAVAMAAETEENDIQANVELLLPSAGSDDESEGVPADTAAKQNDDYTIKSDATINESQDDADETENNDIDVNIQQTSENPDENQTPAEIKKDDENNDQSGASAPKELKDGDDENEPAETVPQDGDQPSSESAEVVYSDKGQTSDGLNWEMTKDPTTGKYTLTLTFEHAAESEDLNITEDNLKNIEQYAAEISAALAAKYGTAWEWDSTAAPSGSEDVQKFQIFLTGDGNKDHTYRYDAEKLEQMDGEFTLEKVDENGNLITGSEATFQLWHVNEITDPDTSETVEVKMFCSYDPETDTYTFVPTESTIQTINGRIEILYAMMKDVVYYLQEVAAPAGYEVDPSIHIVMEKELWEQEDESFRNQFSYLGEFTEDENGRIGLDVKFTDVKKGAGDYTDIATPTPIDTPEETPTQAPDPIVEEPDTAEPPVDDDEYIPVPNETPVIPENPPVVVEAEPEPAAPTPVETNDVPKTGDALNVFLILAAVSAMGLAGVSFAGRRKESN